MMRIFSASLSQESNTFSPMFTGYQDFLEYQAWRPGEHPAEPSMQSAPFWVARERAARDGFELIPGSCFSATPGGRVTRDSYERMRDEILGQLQAAMPLDGVVVGLHGAMSAVGYDDCEGDLLERVRRILGPKVTVGILLDLHCHLTLKRCEFADLIVLYKEYPHIDFIERSEELLDMMLRTIRGEIKPVKSLFECRVIASFPTTIEPMRSLVDRASATEGKDGVLSVSLGHGFASGDVPECGARILVITDDAKATGDAVAQDFGIALARIATQHPRSFLEPDEAISEALKIAETATAPVIIADTTDNAGSGAPSDNTTFIRLLMDRGISGASVGPVWDPGAVRIAMSAGVGAKLPLRIGGKVCAQSRQPIDTEVEVLACVPEGYQSFAGTPVPLGPSVGIRTKEGVGVVLVTHRRQAMGADLFSNMGIDPTGERILVVKSIQHFHASFAPIGARVLYATGDGLIATDYRKYDYKHVQRPIFPLDGQVEGRLLL